MISRFDETRRGLDRVIRAAFTAAAAKGLLPAAEPAAYVVEIPADPKNGDFSTNAAMVNARAMRCAPQKIAAALLECFDFGELPVERCEMAGPGFINFYMKQAWFGALAGEALEKGARYGRSDYGQNEKVMVEYVSANPTGPMHMGNARGGAIGDCLAAALEWSGHDVTREFYVNDAGNQINKFGASLSVRYMQLFEGEEKHPLPEDCYQGMDILDHAREFAKLYGDKYVNAPEEERRKALVDYALPLNIAALERDLGKYRIHYDVWFRESLLHQQGKVMAICEKLRENGYAYEKEGALWYNNIKMMSEKAEKAGKPLTEAELAELKDDVLVRANGVPTYFAADIAYHYNKFAERGFHRVINVWGADHHGHVARLKGAMDALGLDGEHRLDIVLMQLVKLVRDGEVVRMSKRTGKAISLTDLLDEIPVDACRWFFNAKPDTQMEFDLGLAVREDSENPVYYVQYAYARICTLLKALAAEGYDVPAAAQADLALLTADEEKALIKQLAQYPVVVRLAARDYDPSFINRYLSELAAAFHKFYNACRIKGEEKDMLLARLKLADTARAVLKNGMTLIGCSAPEKM